MLEVIALVCTMQAPLQCRNVSLTFAVENATPFQCIRYGQTELAKWTQDHPNWQVHKWTCRKAGMFAKI